VNAVIVGLGAVIALAAAAYSTWSPCGQSMLSQITPLGERSRNHKFWFTASWFIAGAIAGGATFGLLIAALAALVSAIGVAASTAAGLAAVLALLAAASDAHVLGFGPPFFRRQVNETWLPKYRSWLYGLGFGWQIGAGFATYIMTTAVLLTIALGALTASPLAGFALGVLFGTVRGLAVLLAARITTPAALASFHQRFDALGPTVQRVVIGVQAAVAISAGVAAAGVAGGAIAAAGVAAIVAVSALRRGAGLGARARTRRGSGAPATP
jgi:hypothetical protein